MATNVFNFSSFVNDAPEQLIYRGCVYVRSENNAQSTSIAQSLYYRGVSYSIADRNNLSARSVAGFMPLRYRGLSYYSPCYSNA